MADQYTGMIWTEHLTSVSGSAETARKALSSLKTAMESAARAAEQEPASVAASMYAAIKEEVEAVDEELTVPHNLINRLKFTVVPAAFDREGVKTLTTDSGYRVTVNPDMRASMVDKEAAFEWLRDNGLEDLITETVNASTLKAALRQKLADDGIEPPETVIKVDVGFTTSVTKVKGKTSNSSQKGK